VDEVKTVDDLHADLRDVICGAGRSGPVAEPPDIASSVEITSPTCATYLDPERWLLQSQATQTGD
jgi:hypothetical protein